jgi:hypothetical protein
MKPRTELVNTGENRLAREVRCIAPSREKTSPQKSRRSLSDGFLK